ncbi:MAG: M28 family peptidase [Minicystis sp.]
MSIQSEITRTRQERRQSLARARKLGLALAGLGGAIAAWAYVSMIRMPGASFAGPFEPLSEHERAVEASLRRDVEALAGTIGDRSVPSHAGLVAAASYIDRAFTEAGYRVQRQTYEVSGKPCDNLVAELPGSSEIVVVGAHYDSVAGTVGADDNGSGVAALLALARDFAGKKPARTVRFVAFANEEPPYFQQASMGSVVYARESRARKDDIVAMLSLETLGYYTDQPGSQKYPFPFGLLYPKVGDFVAFVGDKGSADLVRRVVGTFRKSARFPSEGIAGPAAVPGIGWSDQWSFWQNGYPGVMVTDTAPFRYPHYHERTDTPDKLTYGPMARVVVGLGRVVEDLAGGMR